MTLDANNTLLGLTAQIVSAHLSKNPTPATGVPALIEQVYAALAHVGAAPVVAEKHVPAVNSKRSVFPDYIICLEDGRKLKTLKRHLRSTFDLSPEQYREKWDLPPDYPMVAPNYAEHRSRLAKELGLGRKPAGPQPAPAVIAAPPPEPISRPEPTRRSEPTAASVFSKFPKEKAETKVEPDPDPPKAKRGRKPFSKQLARGMRR